ncbi:hydroxymethylglutaryl-CoA reductase [candidate division KSB1 bacterium]|nr:hydroxymethylglutaryl-CoA reductase [candidate division KSB1 bacterium]
MRGNKKEPELSASVPMRIIGPARLTGPIIDESVPIPLATFETPLWPSTERGAGLSRHCEGIRVVIVDERMSRSILVQAKSAQAALEVRDALAAERQQLQNLTAESSRFARFLDLHSQIVGDLLYIRLEFATGDAAGHNMATKAADRIMRWVLSAFPQVRYVSISGNYCTDKKVSAVNGILGRGKNTIAEMGVSHRMCERFLKTTPEKIVDLNIKKNLLGSLISGGVRSANAHFANMLLAFYLATGQDAANIVEGSQGFTHAENRDGDLYFSVTLPNLIIGTVGSGKTLDFVRHNLHLLGCDENREPGENARRLAAIAAAAVWCGEISLLAAQTNPGELMQAHERLERL